jgi:hypothetical protein
MATDSILGLFTTPEQYQQAQNEAALARGVQLAQLDPFQRASAQLYQGGYMAGGALGQALGAQDPMLQRISQQQSLLKDVDFTDSASLSNAARQAVQMGRPDIAQQLAARAIDIQSKIDEKQAARDQQLQIARERIQANLDIAAQRGADAKELQKMRIEGQKELRQLAAGMGSGLTNIRQQILEEKLASEKEKRASASEATMSRLGNMVDNANNVISTIKTAKEQVSGTTAGIGGRLLSLTESATDLEENLNSIKANLGFDRLQQMRNESKTGGALGQVAVKELDRLEAARASLNRTQSPEQLKKNLDNVLTAYTNWRDAANKALAEKQAMRPAGGGATGAAGNDPLGIRK